jgi:Domain of unknown function (DUF4157)
MNRSERIRIPGRRAVASVGAAPLFAPRSFAAETSVSAAAEPFGHHFRQLPMQQPQAKLTVNTPGDAYEQEADSVANQVMKMDAPGTRQVAREEEPEEEAAKAPEQEGAEVKRVMRDAAPEGAEEEEKPPANPEEDKNVQRKCAECAQEDEEKVARAGTGDVSADADVSEAVNGGLQSGGQPLDADARRYMEPRFGHDFSHVRIHTDAKASDSTEAVSARAYTVGSDIAFRSGEYAPGSSGGRLLLAHELSHVVQQGGSAAVAPAVSRTANEEALQRAVQRSLTSVILDSESRLQRDGGDPPDPKDLFDDDPSSGFKPKDKPGGPTDVGDKGATFGLKGGKPFFSVDPGAGDPLTPTTYPDSNQQSPSVDVPRDCTKERWNWRMGFCCSPGKHYDPDADRFNCISDAGKDQGVLPPLPPKPGYPDTPVDPLARNDGGQYA